MSDAPPPLSGDFRIFLQRFAMQGFFALGMIELPGQPKQEPNLPFCKTVIDDLEMLREKTRGNLSDGETQTLDKYISDLKFQYVARSGAAEGGESA